MAQIIAQNIEIFLDFVSKLLTLKQITRYYYRKKQQPDFRLKTQTLI